MKTLQLGNSNHNDGTELTIVELCAVLHSQYGLTHITEKFLRAQADNEILVFADYREGRHLYHRDASIIRLLASTKCKMTGVKWGDLKKALNGNDFFSVDSINMKISKGESIQELVGIVIPELRRIVQSDIENTKKNKRKRK